MRIIDADALQRFVIELTTEKGISTIHAVFETTIQNAPTIDAEPVRYGRWLETGYYDTHRTPIYQCSVCWKEVADHYITQHKFCLHCGAKMRGAEE